MNLFTAKWPFYVSGLLIALLLVGSLALFQEPIGLSEAITAVTDFRGSDIVHGELPEPPPLDWQVALLFGLLFGAILAAATGGGFKFELSDESGSFMEKTLRTVFGGLVGGFLVMLGIQLAGETVWGQFAAAIQLSSGAWLFLGALALTGSLLAILLERRGQGGGGSGAKSKGKAKPAKGRKA